MNSNKNKPTVAPSFSNTHAVVMVVHNLDHQPGDGDIPDHYSVVHFQREHDPLTRRFTAGGHVGVGGIIVNPRFDEGKLRRGSFNYQLLINCNHEAVTTRETSRKAVFASMRTHAEQNHVTGLLLADPVPTSVAQELTTAFAKFPRVICIAFVVDQIVSQNDFVARLPGWTLWTGCRHCSS
jgi:hypothetical protein